MLRSRQHGGWGGLREASCVLSGRKASEAKVKHLHPSGQTAERRICGKSYDSHGKGTGKSQQLGRNGRVNRQLGMDRRTATRTQEDEKQVTFGLRMTLCCVCVHVLGARRRRDLVLTTLLPREQYKAGLVLLCFPLSWGRCCIFHNSRCVAT